MEWKKIALILRAIEFLSNDRGTTIHKLQTNLGLSRRSVYRLLDILQEMNFPIYEEKRLQDRKKYWKLEPGFVSRLPSIAIPNIELTKIELLLLYFLISGHALFKNTGLEKHIASLKEKLELFLPISQKRHSIADKLQTLFVMSEHFVKDYSGKEEIIEILIEAIVKQKTCVITYHAFSTDEIRTYRIDPFRLFERNGGLYAFVRTTFYQSIRMIAVERIQECTVLDESFEFPQDFNPEALLETAFQLTLDDPVTTKIWFDHTQARYIKERKWSSIQEIEDNEDGSIVISINTSGVFDLMRWILSFGSSAKVLEPEFLAQQILDETEKMRDQYRK